ncbi:MAG: hypothetical protein H6825_07005 [Planctomycetes bacterium]|nr:hypothetical protein [Planctomycetota bacterium]
MSPDAAQQPTRDEPLVTLRLADFPEKQHLAGEGNWLYLIPFRGGRAVLKIYHGTRSPIVHLRKTVNHWLVSGRTSHMPRARRDREMECTRLWEACGFRSFRMRPEVRFADLPEDGYMLFEYVPGTLLRDHLRDEELPLEARLDTWRRFVLEQAARHALAVGRDEPRLIHENGDCKHVMLHPDGGFLTFDLEIGFRSRHVRDLAGREVLAHLASLGRHLGERLYARLLADLVAVHPDRGLLDAAWQHVFANPSPVLRAARGLERRLRSRAQKRFSKHRVAADLRAALASGD